MHPTSTDKSLLSEPNTADQSCSLTDGKPQQPQTGFTPLHNRELNCLLGFRSDACASELYDEAIQRQHAVLGLLCALSGTPNLDELASEPLGGCIQAIRLLCSDATALYSAAWYSVQQDAA